ncbi:MAG: PorV/PorQ family protein [candidate division KSB1 bacterium]|nr:PorV/PorQ family protein [candidate division KSB1 bacterium]MDZ7336036.1 PorV/PorQ family protein [candidate division KSB1 bacterium]MDZ7358038.1 PorV/PorQ family protein [candidate division KSB1 bacterium]MDZ7401088.1 PorV/PorQ family protein [candidate division KSB1 bacterium]
MRSIRFTIPLFVITALLLRVSVSNGQKVGSTSMQFLKVTPGARATALGEAYAAWAAGPEAVFWNPAGLARLEKMGISTSYINWLFDAQQGAIAAALTIKQLGAIGFQVQYADFGQFDETSTQRPYISDPDNPGFTGRIFHPFSFVVGVCYARDLTDKFSVGFGMKYAYESLFNGDRVIAMIKQGVYEEVKTWASVVLFDFGIRYNTGYRSIHIGSSVQNFGPDVKYAKESHPVPLLFRFGIGADLIGPDGLLSRNDSSNRLGLAGDIFHPNDYDQQVHFGLEYEFAAKLALRAGYKFNYDFDGLTFGAGIKHQFEGVLLTLDYSYGDMGDYLGYVQRISMGIALP